MSTWDNFFNTQGQVRGSVGNAVANVNQVVQAPNLYANVSPILEPSIDEVWGGISKDSRSSGGNNYFDYYFSGQDVSVTVDGTESDPVYGQLPLESFAFKIEQEKQPVYGFWSYTYDAVMRGRRIVSGTFTLHTRAPNYMKQVLALAAKSRQENKGSLIPNYSRPLTEDDSNIEKYWGKNMDPTVALGANTNMFSIHPPFSFVILYGIQAVSVNDSVGLPIMNDPNMWSSDNTLYTDVNERLVDADPISQTMRIVIDDCELTSFGTMYDNSGNVVKEVYEFFARDIVIANP